jgi:hypothetical protein
MTRTLFSVNTDQCLVHVQAGISRVLSYRSQSAVQTCQLAHGLQESTVSSLGACAGRPSPCPVLPPILCAQIRLDSSEPSQLAECEGHCVWFVEHPYPDSCTGRLGWNHPCNGFRIEEQQSPQFSRDVGCSVCWYGHPFPVTAPFQKRLYMILYTRHRTRCIL